MKTTHIFLVVMGILMYNVFLIHRDKQMFEAYDQSAPVKTWNSQKSN
jgi:endonuclease I